MKILESELYKFIPNALEMDNRISVWEYIQTLDFRINWPDYNGIEEKYSVTQQMVHGAGAQKSQERDRHGNTTMDYLNKAGIPHKFNDEVQELIRNRPANFFVCNLSFAGQQYWSHTHQEQESLVYYANTEWRNEWGGETIIYEKDGETFHAAVPYKPGAVLWLKEGVPHSLRAPTFQAPLFRHTIGLFYGTEK